MTRGFTRILVPTDFSAPSTPRSRRRKTLQHDSEPRFTWFTYSRTRRPPSRPIRRGGRLSPTGHQRVVAARGRQTSQCAADASGTLRVQGDDHGALQRIGGEEIVEHAQGQHQPDRDGHARPRRSRASADRQCGRARRSDRNVPRSDGERDCDSARIHISSGGGRGCRRMITRPSRARTSRCGSGPDRD